MYSEMKRIKKQIIVLSIVALLLVLIDYTALFLIAINF